MTHFTHWHIEKDNDDILWAKLDKQDSSVNTLNDEVLNELESICLTVNNGDYKGLVIFSGKEKGFIAGADIEHFSKFKDSAEVVQFLKKGQRIFDTLESLAIPTVAMIDGFCMGGGMELALACQYRIASNEEGTRLGLPEIMLGIHPGWGGTVRLPKLIGGFNAVSKVILTGRAFRATAAKKIGFIDEVVASRQLKPAAIYFIKNKPQKHVPTFLASLTNKPFMRNILSKLIRKNIDKKVNVEHYPAFKAVVDIWEQEGGVTERAQRVEADSIAGLISKNDTSKNLIRAYFLREKMKGFSKESSFKASHVHVIGAGVMGGDIAAWCALKGVTVTLQDRTLASIAPAIKRASTLYKKKLKKSHLVQAAMDKLIPDPMGNGIKKADVIIEAIFENLEAKQVLFKEIEKEAKKTAILASNTSSILLDDINTVLENPERLIGIHFFNPVARMELVEVVASKLSSTSTLKEAYAFVGQMGRLSLPVKSSPGFLVNRVLMPYLMECVALIEEGYSGEVIDKAAEKFGMMMGPVELADTVGLDVCLAVAENLTKHYGGTVPERLRDYVKNNRLGKKTGKGFYEYNSKGKPIKKQVELPQDELISNRLILRMVNESASCLREGIVENSDLLDGAMIFGAGFAPFHGGPMQYSHSFGEGKLNALFSQLENQYGERFRADEGL